MTDVSMVRLYILRAMYAVLGLAEGTIQFQLFLHHPRWTLNSGVAHSFLAALAALSLVGIFYPLRMLPLLVYELLWKSIWLLGIALPLWLRKPVRSATKENVYECICARLG